MATANFRPTLLTYRSRPKGNLFNFCGFHPIMIRFGFEEAFIIIISALRLFSAQREPHFMVKWILGIKNNYWSFKVLRGFNDSGIATIIFDQSSFRWRKRIKKNTTERPSILPELGGGRPLVSRASDNGFGSTVDSRSNVFQGT